MYIISVLFSNCQRIPIIINKSKTPFLLPLLFTITNLKEKSYSTKSNYIKVICRLYSFLNEKDINIEEMMISGHFNPIISNLESFLIFELGSTDRKNIDIISNFLNWCSYKYSNNSEESLKIKSILSFSIERKKYSIRSQYRSLNLNELEIVRNVIDLQYVYNPFKIEFRLRNWVIIEILVQSGLRLGELLKLKVNDFIRLEDRFYLKINNHKSDSEDTRVIKPSNKNIYSFRTIAITSDLYDVIQLFIKKNRRNSKKLKHSYLFVSELGNPLSIRAAQDIFLLINKCIQQNYTIKNFEFSAHILRHTFADNFLKFLIEELNLDMERAKDELRMICGWNISSEMPIRYSSRYISSKANEHNITRINNAYK